MCRASRRGARGAHRAPHRFAPRPVLLRHEAGVDPRQCARRARGGREGRTGLRDHRHLVALVSHGRTRTCDRRIKRVAHAPLRHWGGPLAPGTARNVTRARGRAAGGARFGRRFRGNVRRTLRSGDPGAGRGRRPAGGNVRAGGVRARRDEVHLRYGGVRAHQHRVPPPRLGAWPADDGGLAARGRAHVRARGEHLRRRRIGSMASRWVGHHLRRRRDRGSRPFRGFDRRGRAGPGLRRAGAASTGIRKRAPPSSG